MARNCIITGCGRSGTSMTAGCIAYSGNNYNIGGPGYPGNDGNPKGYFETFEVNSINDDMLMNDPRTRFTQGSRHGWLSMFPVAEHPSPLKNTKDRIRKVLRQKPFCIKDTRFSYTLPIWQEVLVETDVQYLCVFRNPGVVVNSILQNCRTRPYLKNIIITKQQCYDIWFQMHLHLATHADKDWIFLHYNQVLSGDGMDKISEALEIEPNREFPTGSLCRSKKDDEIPEHVWGTYLAFCDMAGYKEEEIDA